MAERCFREPLQADVSPQDWYTKSFDSGSRSAVSLSNKSTTKLQSRHTSADISKNASTMQRYGKMTKPFLMSPSSFDLFSFVDEGRIEANEDSSLYKEIILRQHAVPLGDLIQTIET